MGYCMKKQMIAKELIKVAKKIIASSKNDIITFPLLNKMERVDVDLNKPIYTDDMVWGHEMFSVETILSNQQKYKDTVTILVYGYENDQKEKAVWLIDNYEYNGDKRKHVQFCQNIRFALNSSGGLKGFFDPDVVFDGSFERLSDEDQDKLARHIQLCQDKACECAKKLANKL